LKRKIFLRALKISFPVFTGYIAIGTAYGLFVAETGYPAWFAPLLGVVMFTGAGQFMAVSLFAAGTALGPLLAVQFMLAVRHVGYGFSLYSRYKNTGLWKPYLIYALSDETFALLSTLKGNELCGLPRGEPRSGQNGGQSPLQNTENSVAAGEIDEAGEKNYSLLMLDIAALDQSYWVLGSAIGAIAGSLIPWSLEGVSFSITALFIVLAAEQVMSRK
jgi:predicted branched-subunit amino acid permease